VIVRVAEGDCVCCWGWLCVLLGVIVKSRKWGGPGWLGGGVLSSHQKTDMLVI